MTKRPREESTASGSDEDSSPEMVPDVASDDDAPSDVEEDEASVSEEEEQDASASEEEEQDASASEEEDVASEEEDSSASEDDQPAVAGGDAASSAKPAKVANPAKGFASALSTILNRELEDGEAPVLARNTKRAAELHDAMEEKKIRKAIVAKTKELKEMAHTKPDILKKTHEVALKKVAARGVVRLFNAVKDFQSEEHNETMNDKVDEKKKKAKLERVDHVSKEAFMGILKKGKGKMPVAPAQQADATREITEFDE